MVDFSKLSISSYKEKVSKRLAELEKVAKGDEDRYKFLRKLDNADFEVTDWEANFLHGILSKFLIRGITEKQREVIDKLVSKYSSRL